MDADPLAPPAPTPRVAYGYLPPPAAARRGGPLAAGGAAIAVSAAALAAIRDAISGPDGRLPRTAAAALARIDALESHATELRLLLGALGRREVFVRVVDG